MRRLKQAALNILVIWLTNGKRRYRNNEVTVSHLVVFGKTKETEANVISECGHSSIETTKLTVSHLVVLGKTKETEANVISECGLSKGYVTPKSLFRAWGGIVVKALRY